MRCRPRTSPCRMRLPRFVVVVLLPISGLSHGVLAADDRRDEEKGPLVPILRTFERQWRRMVEKLRPKRSRSPGLPSTSRIAISTALRLLEDETKCIATSTGEVISLPDISYELVEPLYLELGATDTLHELDFAYHPVAVDEPSAIEQPRRNQDWWRWWLPSWDDDYHGEDHYNLFGAFAGGSHGEVWRGKRLCTSTTHADCDEALIFKKLRVDHGYRILEAGLREVYFGTWLTTHEGSMPRLYTKYVDHFFREAAEGLELWIVYGDAGMSLRSFLYTGTDMGDYIVYQHSPLWTQLRLSVSWSSESSHTGSTPERMPKSCVGRRVMREVLRGILQAAAALHENGIVHRDIKPSNIMCQSNLSTSFTGWEDDPFVSCVLGDFSSAWDEYSNSNYYTRGPSRAEETPEYSPPEVILSRSASDAAVLPSYDSWSIGVLILELLLGSPNVFTVDQRTRALIALQLDRRGASTADLQRALYLYVQLSSRYARSLYLIRCHQGLPSPNFASMIHTRRHRTMRCSGLETCRRGAWSRTHAH